MNFRKGINKYGNIKTIYNGRSFMSKKEALYCQELDLLKNAKSISDRVISYETQVKYPIVVNGKRICNYFADFKVLYADDRIEVIDVKGYKTSIYILKKKLVEALYNIKIKEV